VPSLQEMSICSRCKRTYYFCDCEDDLEEDFNHDRDDPAGWTQEDEDNLELFEEERRRKLAERNEY